VKIQKQLADNTNKWFENRRDLFIREMLDLFFNIVRSFQETYLIYCNCHKPFHKSETDLLSSKNMDSLAKIWDLLTEYVGTETDKGPLWRLKDLCHQIWPENFEEREVSGSLIDWLVGSVFHEAMKLKENIYILNNYGPLGRKIQKTSGAEVYSRLQNVMSIQAIINFIDLKNVVVRISTDVIKQMEQIVFLLGKTQYLLRIMLPTLARNMLIVRLLAEREDIIIDQWGESLEEVFADMFNGDASAGFCAAGRSYQSGQWYVKALEMYQRALSLNRHSDEAVVKVVQLQAIVNQNQEVLGLA